MLSTPILRPALGMMIVVALCLVASDGSSTEPCPDCPSVPTPLDISCPTQNPLSERRSQRQEGEQAKAGKIPDGFSISNTGEAAYSLTLNVPPGRQGMEPHLSLSYNSGSGEGPYGMVEFQ